jgi:carbonic anhydrase/acetyltransferase-like protein (isoleucine patch superfamily)
MIHSMHIPVHGAAPRIHPTAFVVPNATIMGRVYLEEEVSIWYNVVLRGDINSITIGRRTNVQDGVIMHVTRDLPVVVGEGVTIGHGAIVHACTVGDACLIGMGAILLDNAVIGKGSLVAAGAVVREGFTVPEGVLVAGVPARVVRPLTGEEQDEIRQSAVNYVGYARDARQSYTSGNAS